MKFPEHDEQIMRDMLDWFEQNVELTPTERLAHLEAIFVEIEERLNGR